MAFVLGEDIDQEINQAFKKDSVSILSQEEEIKSRFKDHKKLLIKHLNRKWDICFLETYIANKIVPRGLRDKTIPAEHLHSPGFLEKWKELCINHGISVMKIIVEEEKIQLGELAAAIAESSTGLDPFIGHVEFQKLNDTLKKEIEKTQQTLKAMKQSKFRRDLGDWERGEIFDLTPRCSRSRSRRRSSSRGHKPHSDIDEENITKSVTFLENEGAVGEDGEDRQDETPHTHRHQAPKTKKTNRERHPHRGGTRTRSQQSQRD